MCWASATTRASRARAHCDGAQCDVPSAAAAPQPASTGAIELGNVRGRAPCTHCSRLATAQLYGVAQRVPGA